MEKILLFILIKAITLTVVVFTTRLYNDYKYGKE